jgi:hypothetical protein
MSRKGSRLTERRLIPFEAARDVAYPYDGPRALHRSPVRHNSCLVYPRIAVLFDADRGPLRLRIVGNLEVNLDENVVHCSFVLIWTSHHNGCLSRCGASVETFNNVQRSVQPLRSVQQRCSKPFSHSDTLI